MGVLQSDSQRRNCQTTPRMERTFQDCGSVARWQTLCDSPRDTKFTLRRLKQHISGPHEWKILGINEDDDEIVGGIRILKSPVEEIADESIKTFMQEPNLADELSEWGPAT